MATTTSTALPPVVTREEWSLAREELLAQEKALTRLTDGGSAQRRRLPMVEITTDYVFEGEQGPVSLLDLFDGRDQLILQHFMFGTDWEQGREGCSMMADHMGPLVHLHVTVDGEEQSGISSFLRVGDRVYHTWQTGNRGVEPIVSTLQYLDFTPFGRQEAWEDSPEGWPRTEPNGWWRHHDRYETDGRTEISNGSCCH